MNSNELVKENSLRQRLQSLRKPRDLNLGGPKIIKKQFVPNLNVVRNKDRVKDVTKKIEQKRNIKNNDKFSKQNNSSQRYTQSSGIFSEGAGFDGKRGYRNGVKRSNTKENDITSYMTVPTIKKDSWDYNQKNEKNVFDEIMAADDEIEDEKLPFQMLSWTKNDFKAIACPTLPKLDFQSDKIQQSKLKEEVVSQLPIGNIKLENSDTPVDEYYNESVCSDEHPILTLWRLPDSFACRNLGDNPENKNISDYMLQDMPEGQIGKLIYRKSGRVEIQMGRMKYNLEPADLGSFREEVVALDVCRSKEESAAVLGQIQNRFLLNPDWNLLFNKNL